MVLGESSEITSMCRGNAIGNALNGASGNTNAEPLRQAYDSLVLELRR